MFYDIYLHLCAEHGVAPTSLLTNLGISKSTIKNWERGAEPTNRTKKLIADYFGITVKQLMSGEIEKAPAEAEADEMAEALEELRRRPGMRTLFSLGKNASKEDLEKYINVIKAMGGQEDGDNDN